MKDAEDETFDELAKQQGHWGGGYHAKRQMAADKFCDANCVWTDHHPDCNMAADKLQEPAQEPVALVIDGVLVKSALPEKYTGHLYTTPPQRPWVGLTDAEIAQGCKESWVTEQAWQSAVWWAEDKLKENNG